jgi:hypothetical protein
MQSFFYLYGNLVKEKKNCVQICSLRTHYRVQVPTVLLIQEFSASKKSSRTDWTVLYFLQGFMDKPLNRCIIMFLQVGFAICESYTVTESEKKHAKKAQTLQKTASFSYHLMWFQQIRSFQAARSSRGFTTFSISFKYNCCPISLYF